MINALYELYDAFPSGKGSSRRTRELLSLNNDNFNIKLVCKYKPLEKEYRFPFEIKRIKLSQQTDTYNPIKEGLEYRNSIEKLDLSQYEIIQARSPWAGVVFANKKEKYIYKFIYECNGLPSIELPYTHPKFTKFHQKDLRKISQNEIYCAMKADAIVVVSQITKQYLQDRGIPEEKIYVIPNGVDMNEFYPFDVSIERKKQLYDNPIHPYNGDELILGYIGAIQPWQGIISLIQGLHIIVKEFPNLKLVIAGKGKNSWRKHLRNISKENGVRDHLIMLEETNDLKNIPELINSFDYCISPLEKTPRNMIMGANPIKLYEYMACSSNIIVSDLPLTREILSEKDAHIISYPSSGTFIEEIIKILKIEKHLGKNARKSVEKNTWNSRRKSLESLYKSLLDI